MKKISFIKRLALSAFLSITLLSCQSDDSDVVHSSKLEETFKFATDASGRMADSIPPQILKIMHDDFLKSGDHVKSRQLTNTYDLESGKLTPEAALSGKFSNTKQVVEASSTNYASFGNTAAPSFRFSKEADIPKSTRCMPRSLARLAVWNRSCR